MKGKLVSCLAVATSIVVCGAFVSLMIGRLYSLGQAAVQLGLSVI